jgi:hypothetical protein
MGTKELIAPSSPLLKFSRRHIFVFHGSPTSPTGASTPPIPRLHPMKPTVMPQGSLERSNPISSATKCQRKVVLLSDATNLLLPETLTPIKPRRSRRRPLPQPSDDASTYSFSASATPAPKRSSTAGE